MSVAGRKVGAGAGVADLAEMNRLFQAWTETAYHQAVHSETGQAPAARWEKATPEERAVPEPALLREAFLWSERRKADKTALVRPCFPSRTRPRSGSGSAGTPAPPTSCAWPAPPTPGTAKRSPSVAVEMVRQLGPVTPAAELAGQLNAAGLTTGDGRPFDVKAVQWIRHAYRQPGAGPALSTGQQSSGGRCWLRRAGSASRPRRTPHTGRFPVLMSARPWDNLPGRRRGSGRRAPVRPITGRWSRRPCRASAW